MKTRASRPPTRTKLTLDGLGELLDVQLDLLKEERTPVERQGARVATRPRHRQAGDGHRVAPPRLSAILEMEESLPHGSSECVSRRPHPDSHDVESEPAVGRASDSRRIAETRD